MQVGLLGTALHEATRLLGQQLGLGPDLLGTVDTLDRTAIAGYCPAHLQPRPCRPSRHRSTAGLCNNLHHPQWGAARVAHSRFLPPGKAALILVLSATMV